MPKLSKLANKNLLDLEHDKWLSYTSIIFILSGTALITFWFSIKELDLLSKFQITLVIIYILVIFGFIVSGKLEKIKMDIKKL